MSFQTMRTLRLPVDVVLERVPVASRWIDASWRPVAVIPVDRAPAEGEPCWTPRQLRGGASAQWRFSGGDIELHPTEAEGYYLTLSAPQQVVFVLWRASEDSSPDDPPVFPVLATVSYNEAARFLDAGEHVDLVPMHPLIREWVVPFVAEHYRPEPRRKVRRNDPFADDAPGSERGDQRKKS